MHAEMKLKFLDQENLALNETFFLPDYGGNSLRCIRGKTSGAFIGYGTFQWTTAVAALSLLFVRTKLFGGEIESCLSGDRGSLACSLDDSLSKETGWLSEMFGANAFGRLNARFLLLRTNSGLKRNGPVTIAINPKMLTSDSITIIYNERELVNAADLSSLEGKLSKYRTQQKSTAIVENLINRRENSILVGGQLSSV
jgi:hypothetical protein